MSDPQYTLLLVDDEDAIRRALRRALRGEPYEVLEVASGAEALEVLRARPVDIIIADYMMPHMSGMELLRIARIMRPDSIRIMLTGHAHLDMAVQAINEDVVYRLLHKPWDHLNLKVMLQLATRRLEAERRNTRLMALGMRQAAFADAMDRDHPGLLAVERDEHGAVVVPENDIAEAADEVAG